MRRDLQCITPGELLAICAFSSGSSIGLCALRAKDLEQFRTTVPVCTTGETVAAMGCQFSRALPCCLTGDAVDQASLPKPFLSVLYPRESGLSSLAQRLG